MSAVRNRPMPIGGMSYLRIREAVGNGNAARGRMILEAIAARLNEARQKHPLYAEGPYQALGVIHSEFRELEKAVEHETESRQMDEALDVVATAVRFIGEEHKTERGKQW